MSKITKLPTALAIIVGVGHGTGSAGDSSINLARSYAVALLARSKDKLEQISREIQTKGGTADSFPCDVSSEQSIKSTFRAIKTRFDKIPLRVAVFNSSSSFQMKPFLESSRDDLETSLNVSVLGAFSFAQSVLSELLSHQEGGSLIFTGATASIRGSANVGCFAAGKFGLRALSQSLAREFGPKGIHVAHVIIDGVIDTPNVTEWLGPAKTSDTAYVHLHQQDKNCWTQELDLRPCHEKF
ncbi:uncharacterized protein MELLADRAFT_38530 [Melampsora larici-populina 98AG31]|uniref:NAD(P)-binding protein n=1 Tax=Melampsora larici-populina (strain 98AG31 / pathotype 3-4-7) TaxID=747676 RepID=F4RYF8_MELLP|nr:uncharacterized protein MELLADRAFT_38530 [Melampsora larici-populina 98AG31]EGG02584.1 hypothetical protein MELLADRAFT_38530 [Melampsora larici-populina 98AG31]